jgi:hypothetical protein
MDATLEVTEGKAVVSVDHGINIPYVRVQRIATRKFNQYRKEHRLMAPWALVDRQTRESGGYTVSTDYTYIQMR